MHRGELVDDGNKPLKHFSNDVNFEPLGVMRQRHGWSPSGSVAGFHYALNGAGWEPQEIEPTCEELAGFLKADGADAVVVVPV